MFFKFKLISLFIFFSDLLTHLNRCNIQEYACKKANSLMSIFMRYVLIVVGTVDGVTTKFRNVTHTPTATVYCYEPIVTIYILCCLTCSTSEILQSRKRAPGSWPIPIWLL